MTQQEISGGTGEPSLTEEVQAQPETANEAGTETPALNRAERRAQAKGKKPSGTGATNVPGTGGARGGGARPASHVGQVRFPRTGHK